MRATTHTYLLGRSESLSQPAGSDQCHTHTPAWADVGLVGSTEGKLRRGKRPTATRHQWWWSMPRVLGCQWVDRLASIEKAIDRRGGAGRRRSRESPLGLELSSSFRPDPFRPPRPPDRGRSTRTGGYYQTYSSWRAMDRGGLGGGCAPTRPLTHRKENAREQARPMSAGVSLNRKPTTSEGGDMPARRWDDAALVRSAAALRAAHGVDGWIESVDGRIDRGRGRPSSGWPCGVWRPPPGERTNGWMATRKISYPASTHTRPRQARLTNGGAGGGPEPANQRAGGLPAADAAAEAGASRSEEGFGSCCGRVDRSIDARACVL